MELCPVYRLLWFTEQTSPLPPSLSFMDGVLVRGPQDAARREVGRALLTPGCSYWSAFLGRLQCFCSDQECSSHLSDTLPARMTREVAVNLADELITLSHQPPLSSGHIVLEH